MTTETTLVVGGTGKTGRRVAARLAARGVPVRVGSRAGVPPFRWEDRSTWAPVLAGVRSAYVAYHPDLAFPGAAEAIGGFSSLAVRSGVRRLVLLSGRGEEETWPSERAVRESGAEWTILRASWLAQNFSEHFLLEPVRHGEIAMPAGEVVEPFVDAEDVADVAVAALTCDGHGGRTYELTGPRALSFADAAAEIAKASGRDVRYVPVSPSAYTAALVAAGMPAGEAGPLTALFAKVLDGRNAHVTDGVRRVLGREARDFTDYARDAAASGVWDR
jgi:uncharacterized protein YbjT (DUF2867 family)